MADVHADALSSAEVSAVIVRACINCGGPRSVGESCAECGNPEPPEVAHLGVVSATYKSRWRQLWRHLVTAPLARRRIRRAGRRTQELQHPGGSLGPTSA